MRFSETPIHGLWTIGCEPLDDDRGWFARIFDEREFRARRMDARVTQCSLSYNRKRHTLRGMHYQAEPHGEPKLVRCIRGAIFDVAIDLRADSPTYCSWYGVELTGENRAALFIPPGLAHGFQTLTDDAEVLYQIGHEYVPEAARGVRFDDPAFGIQWPPVEGERIMSERDRTYPDFVRI